LSASTLRGSYRIRSGHRIVGSAEIHLLSANVFGPSSETVQFPDR
jgi:hypothetical protein